MLIGSNSKYLLKQTRSKAKMYEYSVPSELHIAVENNANELLLIAIAAIVFFARANSSVLQNFFPTP